VAEDLDREAGATANHMIPLSAAVSEPTESMLPQTIQKLGAVSLSGEEIASNDPYAQWAITAATAIQKGHWQAAHHAEGAPRHQSRFVPCARLCFRVRVSHKPAWTTSV
jgi:hypothetical protein